MSHKNRKQKSKEYTLKYGDIPIDYYERLEYMCEKYHVSESKMQEIMNIRTDMLFTFEYKDLLIELFEVPEGTPRPRFRVVNRKNLGQAAIQNSQFVHVYSPNASDDNNYMHRLVESELIQLDELIYTPCILEVNCYFPTPKAFSITDKFLAEIGLIRYIPKPDWDNIGKKYSDMYNTNIWLDDSLVVSGTVNKYYSILPRVEIKLRYLNMLQNKYQYNSISRRLEGTDVKYYKYNERKW